MDSLIQLLNLYFDIVFARVPSASAGMAIILTFCSFTLLYLSMVVPAYYASKHLSLERQLNHRNLQPEQIKKELVGSLSSIIVFSLLGGLTFYLCTQQWLTVSGNIGISQWVIEVVVLYIWNEVHFYFAHRLLHTRWLYKTIHLEHHRSICVTPLATWRFHWFEALLLGSVLPLALIFFPFSVWSLMMLPLMSIFWNIIGHSNWSSKLPLIGCASRHHALHHSQFKGNFGFSMPFFDLMFNTLLLTKP